MSEPVAIIGLDCMVPGAKNPEEFWDLIINAKCAIRNLSPSSKDPNYVGAKGVLDDIDKFDADLFGISYQEASLLDPQHRLFLQSAFRALESAGYGFESDKPVTGVFASAGYPQYLIKYLLANQNLDPFLVQLTNDKDYLATRCAYLLNLNGPALTVQSGCSSSLVAIHLACQSIYSGDCEMAIAGGVSLSLPSAEGYIYKPGGIGAKDGVCRAFDAKASGIVRGDGVGVVVLKSLRKALEDKNDIYAVIIGSAVNNDGRRKVGFTAPSIQEQAKVISLAIERAQIDTETISYVETHGTGTSLGDLVEAKALLSVFHERQNPLAIATLKPNIGHLDAASGVVALIKTALVVSKGIIPPSINFDELNPLIDFSHAPFYIPVEQSAWISPFNVRRAGVSSFGMGGTNVHVILEQSFGSLPSFPKERVPLRAMKFWQEIDLKVQTVMTIEDEIIRVWCQTLGRPEIELDQNFFDLGGDSLLALQCIEKLPPPLNSEVTIIDFFNNPTLKLFLRKVCR